MKFKVGDVVMYIKDHPDFYVSYISIGMTGIINSINKESDLGYNVVWDDWCNAITTCDDLAEFEICKLSKLHKAMR